MKQIALLIILSLLLSGSTFDRPEPVCRVATGVTVEYSQPGGTITRTYTRPESIQSVLIYLRMLRPYGPVIPENPADPTYRIVFQYSTGPDSTILVTGDTYLRRDEGDWQKIDTSKAGLLYPLLLLLPSDRP